MNSVLGVLVLSGTRAWLRWERQVCQLLCLKLSDVLVFGPERGSDTFFCFGRSVVWSNASVLCSCTSLSSSGSLD